MKWSKLFWSIGCSCLAACAPTVSSEQTAVDEALAYCDRQVHRTLSELQKENGIDYTMMPKNILSGERHWNCRKADKEEWTGGFWPGILWYDYEATGNDTIRQEAERFTESLEFFSRIPAYDHDLGFLVFCSYGNTRNGSLFDNS